MINSEIKCDHLDIATFDTGSPYYHRIDWCRDCGSLKTGFAWTMPTRTPEPTKAENGLVNKEINIVFAGDMPNLEFVEVEDSSGKSISFGKWIPKDKDGFSRLQFATPSITKAGDMGIEQAMGFKENAGHNQECYYCHKATNLYAGNPSEWPIYLSHRDEPGKIKWHHMGCVTERLIENNPPPSGIVFTKEQLLAILPEKVNKIPGKGCKCAAHGECECGCGADWTDYETWNKYHDQMKQRIEELFK